MWLLSSASIALCIACGASVVEAVTNKKKESDGASNGRKDHPQIISSKKNEIRKIFQKKKI